MNYTEYRNAWEEADSKYPNIPLHADLEISTICNLKCGFCFLQNKKYKRPKIKFMSLAVAKKIIDKLCAAGIPAIKFNWRGEATLNPNFYDIVRYASKKFIDIRLNTNGQYITSTICAMKYFNDIAVSVDSMNSKTYKNIRGGDFYKLFENLGLLHKTYPSKVEVRRVGCEQNKNENFKQDVMRFFPQFRVLEHDVFDRANFTRRDIPRQFCGQPNRRITIAINGDVFPCCVDYGENLKLGNILKDSVSFLWNKSRSMAFRLQHGKWPASCLNCSSYASYNCKSAEVLR